MTDSPFVIIIGVDPGVTTGLASIVIDRRKKTWSYVLRADVVEVRDGNGLNDLWARLRHLSMHTAGPDRLPVSAIVMEQLMAYHASAQEKAEAQGIVRMAASQAHIPIYTYAPSQVRQTVIGSGKAKASDINRVTRELTGLEHTPKGEKFSPHQQDALAAALCHALRSGELTELYGAVPLPAIGPSKGRAVKKQPAPPQPQED